jgi:coenzyme F420-dependent glucose-6-phosphate dehydrogenase
MMTGVVTPLFRYHPAVIAQAAATLDRLSHGRFILGVGTGESINESPLGYQYPGYKERSARMIEALKIMRSLLHGEKISFKGEFYQTENAKLYSPPLVGVPIYMAAGGPKSAVLAGEFADGLILSVKNPQETVETLIKPAQQKSAEIGNKKFAIEASRWTVFAQNQDEAWEALQAWRGLRAPERDKATDPQQLQDAADAMPREEILSKYTVLSSPQDYVNAYSALITDCHANIVTIQTTSVDQEKLIEMLGKEVVPTLKAL